MFGNGTGEGLSEKIYPLNKLLREKRKVVEKCEGRRGALMGWRVRECAPRRGS